MNNPCIRCGKPRVEGKSWKSSLGNSVITHTQTICPDAECQKAVEQGIADKKAKNELLVQGRAKSKLDREKMVAEAKAEAAALAAG